MNVVNVVNVVNVKDSQHAVKAMRGLVRGHWFNPATGEIRGRFMHRNQLSYACADVLAKVLAGSGEYAPKYMGFIYGTDAAPTELADPTQRYQPWADLATNMAAVQGNIQISPITLTPSLVVDGSSSYYTGNGVVFSAHTRSLDDGTYGFPASSPYAGQLADGNYLYHAMLLTRIIGNGVTYIPVARVTLAESGIYLAKPTGFELALEWQISFF